MNRDTNHTVEIPHPLQDIYLDTDGTIKFRENRIVASMFNSWEIDPKNNHELEFSDRDKRQLAMLIGLNVDDFMRLPYVDEDTSEQVNAIKTELLSETKMQSSYPPTIEEISRVRILRKLVRMGTRK